MKYLVNLLLAACLTTSLLAQDTTVAESGQTLTQYRDPHKARILGSIFPGAGHVYAGEYLRGYGYYLATVGAVGTGVMVFIIDRCTFSFLSATSCDPGPQWPHQVLGIAMVGAGVWSWVSSARDAPRAAQRANTRHEARTILVKPIIGPGNESHAGFQAGLQLRW
jgi:hypothetical protein